MKIVLNNVFGFNLNKLSAPAGCEETRPICKKEKRKSLRVCLGDGQEPEVRLASLSTDVLTDFSFILIPNDNFTCTYAVVI